MTVESGVVPAELVASWQVVYGRIPASGTVSDCDRGAAGGDDAVVVRAGRCVAGYGGDSEFGVVPAGRVDAYGRGVRAPGAGLEQIAGRP